MCTVSIMEWESDNLTSSNHLLFWLAYLHFNNRLCLWKKLFCPISLDTGCNSRIRLHRFSLHDWCLYSINIYCTSEYISIWNSVTLYKTMFYLCCWSHIHEVHSDRLLTSLPSLKFSLLLTLLFWIFRYTRHILRAPKVFSNL